MTKVRVFAFALNQTPLDWSGNADRIARALAAARAEQANVVCLPELCVSGYGCEDAFLWPETWRRSLAMVEQVLPLTVGMVVSLGLPLFVDGAVYNASLLLCDGEIMGAACKRHLAGHGIHYEPRWFSPWPKGVVKRADILGRAVAVGDVVFDAGGVRLAFEICEDAWVAQRPAHELARDDVDFILNPSASHFAFGKHLVRRGLVTQGARCARLGYVYCNLLGNEAGRAIYDGDCLIATAGEQPAICAESRRFSFLDFQMAGVTFSTDQRVAPAPVSDPEPTPPRAVVSRPFVFASDPNLPAFTQTTPGEGATVGELPKHEAFARAVALGLFDYYRKARARGFVVSLSGGADSAAVSVLVRLMVRLLWAERGPKQAIRALLPHRADQDMSELELMGQVLTTVYLGTRNSSETTRQAAERVAASLGAEHHEVSVDDTVAAYRSKVETLLGRELTWQDDDLTLQNIQARARAPLVWMLANARRALLLSTSNRSEAAVGYATMDGDTAGGLSPIAGIDKVFIRHWLRFMERQGLNESGAFPELMAINRQQPTAELRPSQYAQTDEADLMPYEVLDAIERAAIYQRLAPRDILEHIVSTFGCERSVALGWLEKFYRLFAGSQWKRERIAPGFFLDEGNLDPKTWFRFPILSGGFADELYELKRENAEPA